MEIEHESAGLSEQMHEALSPLLSLIRTALSMSPGKLGILHTLAIEGRASAARMRQDIGVSQQAILLTTKELEGLGLIERHRDEAVRRKLWFQLTDAGREKLEHEIQLGQRALTQAIGENLSDEELSLIRAALPALKKINTAVRP
ncbi:MarR family winged helix-turn-helix transcriptional regulator [Glutamicibacter nicotianae]|uniref:MarR family winged helix-turn-helix transcriptional regulator n=1 Tax=Glutamicibacter nicotianae TaxID=37929 RepID=UPI00195F19C2|nr:transcriptional regulator [Glutamicibacter nicotianae]MBM7766661.1 DNA-binding MarR family transcriptional regulator [Glutamicibacter nicotianae]